MLRAELGAYWAERDAFGRRPEPMLKADVLREAANRGGADAIETFGITLQLFTEDVEAGLSEVGIFGEVRDEVMDRVRAHARLRLRQSGGMILEQIRIRSGARRPAPDSVSRKNGPR